MQRLSPDEPKPVSLSVVVPCEVAAKVRGKAEARGETVSAWLRTVIEAQIKPREGER